MSKQTEDTTMTINHVIYPSHLSNDVDVSIETAKRYGNLCNEALRAAYPAAEIGFTVVDACGCGGGCTVGYEEDETEDRNAQARCNDICQRVYEAGEFWPDDEN
jgi:hypothetical protein